MNIDDYEDFFWRNLFGGIDLKEFFGRNFLRGFFWEDSFDRIIGRIFFVCQDFGFFQDFVSMKKEGKEFRPLEVRRKLIALKN